MLSELNIYRNYSSDKNDIGAEFYTPLLSETTRFNRISGYFSSRALIYYSKGIEQLIKNNGYYRLIISSDISKEDYDLIKAGYQLKNKLSSKIKLNYEALLTSEKKDISNLAYLIEQGVVDIRIGFTHTGIFHSKFGIFSDSADNQVFFSGSLNETEAAFKYNFEDILVTRSWDDLEDKKMIRKKTIEFDNYWNGTNTDGMVFVKEINEILRLNLIKYSKGKIIMDDKLLNENALILYYKDGSLYVQNNYGRLSYNQENNRSLKKIKNKYLVNNTLWEFKKNLDYKEIEDVIEKFKKFGKRTEIEIFIADSVTDSIKNSKFEIEEIYKRGMLFKNHDASLRDLYKDFDFITSNEISRKLRDTQSWVSFYMAQMKRVANFSVPGAGKTAMVYGTFAYLSSSKVNKIDQLLVIGPKNSFLSWKDEFNAVFRDKRKMKVLDVHSDNFDEADFYKLSFAAYNLILINYESLSKYEKALKKIITSRTMVVFDEVHKVKGIDTIRAPIAIEIAQGAMYRYVLTGTPIPNSYKDIWNFLHILYKSEYNSFFGFSINNLSNPNTHEIKLINNKLNPFFWRVTKSDLDIPKPNGDNNLTYIANSKEQTVIDLLWRKYGKQPFKLYIRLIQAASNPELLNKNIDKSLFYGNEVQQSEDEELDTDYNSEMEDIPTFNRQELDIIASLKDSTKFKACIEKADELIQDNKTIIIWCIFVATIEKLKSRLESLGHKVAVIYGGTPVGEREKIIKDFQCGLYDVLVTNPHTLAESVSLHMIAHDALYLEYSFNLTHMLQSRNRIHRLGLKKGDYTSYYYFMLEGQQNRRNTIDWKIYNRLNEKRDIMVDTIENHELHPEFSVDEKDEIIDFMKEEE
jgi:SNF2 family DNA or RNA helicase